MLGDLTNVANVKGWLNTSDRVFPDGSDLLLGRLISAASQFIPRYLSRNIVPADYSWTTNGWDNYELFTPQFPIIAVSSLTIDAVTINSSTPGSGAPGYLFDDERIYLQGRGFCRGVQNITLAYTAGFQQTDEAATVSIDGLPVSSLMFTWNSDRGIKYANGVAFVKVTVSPTVGQYVLELIKGVWTYSFNAADVNAAILVTYGYTPSDLEQAIIEFVGEAYKRRERIGQSSKGFAQETVTFSQADMNASLKSMLQPFKSVVPVL